MSSFHHWSCHVVPVVMDLYNSCPCGFPPQLTGVGKAQPLTSSLICQARLLHLPLKVDSL